MPVLIENDWEIHFNPETNHHEHIWTERHSLRKKNHHCYVMLWRMSSNDVEHFSGKTYEVFIGIDLNSSYLGNTRYKKDEILEKFELQDFISDIHDRWGIFFGFDFLDEAIEFMGEAKMFFEENYD